MEIKKTSQQWYESIPKEFKFIIMDPDGWDRKNYEYSFNEELITKEEFVRRTRNSTCMRFNTIMPDDWFDVWLKEKGKKWFISDNHFSDNRFNLFYRPFKTVEEQDSHMIEMWNSVVGVDDDVFHIGDAATSDEGLQCIKKLNGRKHLIKGNYDVPRNQELLEEVFDTIQDGMYMCLSNGQTVYLNHYPGNAQTNVFNIVGHIHSLWKVQRNMINVSVEAWNYTPVSEEQILFCMNAIDKFYDEHVFAGELSANIPKRVLYTGDKI